MASRLPVNSLTTNAPHTDPIGRQTPSTPETWPRWTDGIWSGMTATIAASSALKHSWVMHHPRRTTGMLGASATITMPREPPARPVTIQGRRMPSCDVVRSLIRPKNGLATMASRAPAAATSARLAGARWFPTSESTFKAKVTSTGARNSRLVLMYASVYSEMKPHPTRRAPRGSGSSATAAAVRSCHPSSAAEGGRYGGAAGALPPGPETSGIALLKTAAGQVDRGAGRRRRASPWRGRRRTRLRSGPGRWPPAGRRAGTGSGD